MTDFFKKNQNRNVPGPDMPPGVDEPPPGVDEPPPETGGRRRFEAVEACIFRGAYVERGTVVEGDACPPHFREIPCT